MSAVMESYTDDTADKIIAECAQLIKPRSFFLFAGAGSGKTRSLVTVLKEIQKNQRDLLMSRGQKVAVITYTNAACDVISQRLDFDPLIQVSTIHSFAWDLIGNYNTDIRVWLRAKLEEDISELQATLAKTRTGTKVRVERESSLTEKLKRLASLEDIKVFVYSPTGENSSKESLTHSEVIQLSSSFLTKKALQSILIGKFPFLFIDESQDTNTDLIDSLLAVQAVNKEKFCLGLFGDMMQRIYSDGKVGLDKAIPEDWAKPEKVVNWRCPRRIVRLINEIRKPVDGREQKAPPKKPEGFIRCFICSSSTQDKPAVEGAVALRMADLTGDRDWCVPDRCKTLTLEHHMAARRLGFGEFFLPLYEVSDFRTGLIRGTLSGFPLFFDAILPLIHAIENEDKFEIARVVRTMSPLLRRRTLAEAGEDKIANVGKAREAVDELSRLLKGADPRAIDVLKTVSTHKLFDIPENLRATLHADKAGVEHAQDDPEVTIKGAVSGWREALQAPISQVRLTAEYLSDVAKFDTHQGVKGREFPRVIVVMDDVEARGFLFNFDKLLGATPKSKTDLEHEAKGEETTIDRTRRLFYVTCSRAEKSLALIVYSTHPEQVREFLLKTNWLVPDEIELIA